MGANCAAALNMPRNYVVMEVEEMTYTEGGAYYGLNWSAEDCRSLADGLNTHATLVGTYATVLSLIACIPGVNVTIGPAALYFGVAGTSLTLSSAWLSKAAENGGCHLGYDSSKKEWTAGWGMA